MWSSPRVVIICTRFVVLIVGAVSRTCRDIEEDTVVVLSLFFASIPARTSDRPYRSYPQ